MEFTITFNTSLTLSGNVSLPSGAVLKCTTIRYNTTPVANDLIEWQGLAYSSPTSYTNNEDFLVIKNLTEGQKIPQTGENIGRGIAKGQIKTSDFTATLTLVGNKNKLTTQAADDFIVQVIAYLATLLSIQTTDMAGVVDVI